MRTLVLIGCVLLMQACSQQEAATGFPDRQAPSFSGTDQSGRAFTSAVLRGKPWIASFFFTSCESVCPALNLVQQQLVSDFGGKVGFVSISTDPEADTGATLSSYAAMYHATPGSWWMITMPEAEMREVATKGFLLMDPKEPAMHSTRFVAVDSEGSIEGYFDSTDSSSMEKLRTWIHSQL